MCSLEHRLCCRARLSSPQGTDDTHLHNTRHLLRFGNVPKRDGMCECVCVRLHTCLIHQMHLQLIWLWYWVLFACLQQYFKILCHQSGTKCRMKRGLLVWFVCFLHNLLNLRSINNTIKDLHQQTHTNICTAGGLSPEVCWFPGANTLKNGTNI